MLTVNFSFDIRAKGGETLLVSPIDTLPIAVRDTETKSRRIRIRNQTDKAVSLTGFQTDMTGPESQHVMVSVSDPSPFDVPANGSKIARIEITPLQIWPNRVSVLARISARESPSAA